MMDAGLLKTGAVSCHNAHRRFLGRPHDEVNHPTTRETRFVIIHTGGKPNLLTVQSHIPRKRRTRRITVIMRT